MINKLREIAEKSSDIVEKSFKIGYEIIKQGVDKMNELGAEKVIKVEQKIDDERVFIQKGDNLERVCLFNPQDKDSLIITFSNNEKLRIRYVDLMRALRNDAKDLYQKHQNLDLFMAASKRDEDFIKNFNAVYEKELEIAELDDFVDITDYLFNNFEKIDKSTITSQGLWAGNGIREIEIDYNIHDFLSISEKGKSELSVLIDKKNNDVLEKFINFKITNNIIYLDTDSFNEYMDEEENEADFYGYIIAKIEKEGDEFYQYHKFQLKVINPLAVKEDKDVVSIDFGTSSTCVAIKKGRELVAFTDNPESVEDYENQSAIIIFNWRKIYNEWGVKSRTIPHFNRSKNNIDDDKFNIQKEHFNYSNYVKEELQEAPSTKTIDAVITELKSLPVKLAEDRKNKDSIKPFDNFKNNLFLTDDIEEEDDKTLNPIASYAYFIGRSLNLQIKNQPYTRYKLTMPVKFNKELRESLRSSIEYGLRRSLPKVLKDEIDVSIGFDESVALIGAGKRLKHFKKDKDYKKDGYLFAVFDFGGGTLDFSFGLFRKRLKDDRAILEKEQKYSDIVEIFGTDGMRLGGEKLIERLSYRIYIHNKEKMKEKKIPIFIPENEEKITAFPENLFGTRHIDKLNLRNISEKISRDFFINGKTEKSTANLFSIDDAINEKEIELELSEEKMREFLDEEVKEAVENFRKVLTETFKKYKDRIELFGFEDFDISEVKIFQAGNTCKSQWVKNAFNSVFKEHPNILFLEEKDAKDELKKVTVKNAVAKGALFLEGSGFYDHTKDEEGLMPLDRYVWYKEEIEDEGEDAEPALSSGDNQKDKEFVFIGVANDDFSFTLYYSFQMTVEDLYDDNLKYHDIKIPEDVMDEENCFVYAKPYDGKVIELAFDEDDDCETDSLEGVILVNLDNGNIEVKNG